MASTFAGDLATILADAGTAGFLRTYSSVYDPATGTNTNTATDVAVKIRRTAYSLEETDGTLVQRGDMRATIAAAGLTEPTTAAKLVIGGVEWSIQAVGPRDGNGAVVSYQLQIRK